MSLPAGTHLGPYEILSLLGAGGMGEVYRARDGRLGREVAVKVLPASLSKDADRLGRFEQEARATGQLDHPNILAVHDLGTHEGCPYVVTELLEGETLREKLKAGELAPRKAVDYARQIAHGLAAAHEKGIVHRDLKPENLFITRDGRVKILDFGLAKLTHPEGARGGETSLPTTPVATDPGVVMGTVGYMSPEQVRGKATDHRSDIFALGAILYEMLSGRRAFHCDSNAETMSAILKEDPPEISGTTRHVSPGLEAILNHCLEKDPEQRFQSARDVAFALEAVSGVSGASQAQQALAEVRPRKAVWSLASGLAVLACLGVAFVLGRRSGERQAPTFQQLTFRRGTVWSARFTPDGQSILYSAAWEGKPPELFTTRRESPESARVDLPSSDLLAISSSGELALLLRPTSLSRFFYTGTLARAPIAGGAPREVLEDVQYADWSPNGRELAVVKTSGPRQKYTLEYPMGRVLYETAGWISHARISPDGEHVAFLDHAIALDDRGAVAVVDRAGKKTRLSADYSSADGLAWSPGRREIWYTAAEAGNNRVLWAVTLSGRRRLVTRVPGALTLQDISPSGQVLLTRDAQRRGIMGLVPGATTERDLSWLDWSFARAISPDGKTILFDEQGEAAGAKYFAYLRKTDGSPAVRLGEGYGVALSPDGKSALSIVPYASPPRVVLLPTGAGEAKPLTSAPFEARWAGWLPNGKRVFILGHEPSHGDRLYVQELEGGKPKAITPEGAGEGIPSFFPSADGRSVLTRDPDGNARIYPVEGGEGRLVPFLTREDIPIRWTAGGRKIFVTQPMQRPLKVYQLDLVTGRKLLWKSIMPSDGAGVTSVGPLMMTPDARYYVYSYTRYLSDLYVVEGLK